MIDQDSIDPAFDEVHGGTRAYGALARPKGSTTRAGSSRLEVRLDSARHEQLRRILKARHESASSFVRAAIDREYQEIEERAAVARALAAVDGIAAGNDDWVPADPEELERIIDEVAFD